MADAKVNQVMLALMDAASAGTISDYELNQFKQNQNPRIPFKFQEFLREVSMYDKELYKTLSQDASPTVIRQSLRTLGNNLRFRQYLTDGLQTAPPDQPEEEQQPEPEQPKQESEQKAQPPPEPEKQPESRPTPNPSQEIEQEISEERAALDKRSETVEQATKNSLTALEEQQKAELAQVSATVEDEIKKLGLHLDPEFTSSPDQPKDQLPPQSTNLNRPLQNVDDLLTTPNSLASLPTPGSGPGQLNTFSVRSIANFTPLPQQPSSLQPQPKNSKQPATDLTYRNIKLQARHNAVRTIAEQTALGKKLDKEAQQQIERQAFLREVQEFTRLHPNKAKLYASLPGFNTQIAIMDERNRASSSRALYDQLLTKRTEQINQKYEQLKQGKLSQENRLKQELSNRRANLLIREREAYIQAGLPLPAHLQPVSHTTSQVQARSIFQYFRQIIRSPQAIGSITANSNFLAGIRRQFTFQRALGAFGGVMGATFGGGIVAGPMGIVAGALGGGLIGGKGIPAFFGRGGGEKMLKLANLGLGLATGGTSTLLTGLATAASLTPFLKKVVIAIGIALLAFFLLIIMPKSMSQYIPGGDAITTAEAAVGIGLDLRLDRIPPDNPKVENGQEIKYKITVGYTNNGKADIEVFGDLPDNVSLTNIKDDKWNLVGKHFSQIVTNVKQNEKRELSLTYTPLVNDKGEMSKDFWIVNSISARLLNTYNETVLDSNSTTLDQYFTDGAKVANIPKAFLKAIAEKESQILTYSQQDIDIFSTPNWYEGKEMDAPTLQGNNPLVIKGFAYNTCRYFNPPCLPNDVRGGMQTELGTWSGVADNVSKALGHKADRLILRDNIIGAAFIILDKAKAAKIPAGNSWTRDQVIEVSRRYCGNFNSPHCGADYGELVWGYYQKYSQ